MNNNNHINYIEFKAQGDLDAIKAFYSRAFNWKFTDYGPTYTAFASSGLEGGFELREEPIANGGTLVILYHDNLRECRDIVKNAGGTISKEIFSFPGGKRFHFLDPSGNELAVWSDK
mmetsp:Transcript_11231/g.17354  ORF Transcript_11231/g.17354 Transcript_11231/m.17354 type:complete len:117 (-) Transcript_11231:374-724(-)|eukprot:CAMPEP_0178917622 /NCGR_PEP_ID=MMETSP0786-20121207/13348_1 /TAXON_ID=186022 /ORGANISM="Thalassionema frauenfeldii, Strain CCMP 1798" /LENGTH=116 /DNA_ID=CAMNT_0020591191 /DNA_START=114 /DNA_END=464 /DNA_ORIENTATION=+